MSYYFVADIGGTNARFGCVHGNADASVCHIENPMTFSNEEFDNINELIQTYFDSIPECEIAGGCLAVAGPTFSDYVKLTNLGWSFSIADLRIKLGMTQLAVINDFVSLAYSLSILKQSDLTMILNGSPNRDATRVVLGPGTGLGAAAVIIDTTGHRLVIGTEAGHMGFAPRTGLEIEILNAMLKSDDYVCIEDLISGSALPGLYKRLVEVRGGQAEDLTAVEITRNASKRTDPVCMETVSLLCSMLSSFAGDMALCLNAGGGVYLGGGLLSKLELSTIRENFEKRFRDKGRISHTLTNVPVYLIQADNAALIGASSYYRKEYIFSN